MIEIVQGAKGLTVHMACGRLYACFVVGGWLSARLSIALWVAASTWPWSASASSTVASAPRSTVGRLAGPGAKAC